MRRHSLFRHPRLARRVRRGWRGTAIALGLAWAGEKKRALAEVERLLQVPWGLNVYFSRVSFRPLRDDPRFKALMADPKNNAPMF